MSAAVFTPRLMGALAVTLVGLGLGYGMTRWGKTGPEPRSDYPAASPTPVALAEPERPRSVPTQPGPQVAAAGKRALLVGVTRYDNLPERMQLEGPANDVELLRTLLVERFQFPPENILTLTEKSGRPEGRPTRANIERAFRQLAADAQPDDQVVILLAGHGSQQPEHDPPNPVAPEPDGLDEIFLPADVAAWDGQLGAVKNAVIDDELAIWLKAITDRQASIWLIEDTCHAGSMTRGPEVMRDVPPNQLGIPAEALDAARRRSDERAAARGEKTRGTDVVKPAPVDLPDDGNRLVALYACRSDQTEPEGVYPPTDPHAQFHGLLSYTLCEVLSQAATPLSYRELTQQIAARYAAQGRSFPTPLVEGKEHDVRVLGKQKWPGRSALRLAKDGEGLKVDQGTLHGLTVGSVLAVYPAAGQADSDRLLGHVRVSEPSSLSSRVVPCDFAGKPAVADLPPGSRCEVVALDYSQRLLTLAIETTDPALRRQLEDLVRPLGEGDQPLIQLVTKMEQAAWVVRLDAGQLTLQPTVRDVEPGGATATVKFGTAAPDDQARRAWLETSLRQILQAQGLLAVAGVSEAEKTRGRSGDSVDIEVEVVRYKNRNDPVGEVLDWPSGGRTVTVGDSIALRLHNPNTFPVDVTMLYVDSGYGITPFWPAPGSGEENRLRPGITVTTPRGRVQAGTLGLEHLVILAVKAQKDLIDFTDLAQPSLERAQGVRGTKAPETPLRQLMEWKLYGGKSRGPLAREEVDQHAARILTWRVVAAPAAAAPK